MMALNMEGVKGQKYGQPLEIQKSKRMNFLFQPSEGT